MGVMGKNYIPILDLQAHVPHQMLQRSHGGGVGEFNSSGGCSCGLLSFLVLHPYFLHFSLLLFFGPPGAPADAPPLVGRRFWQTSCLHEWNSGPCLGWLGLTHREEEFLNPSLGRLPSRCGVSKYEAVPTRWGMLTY